MPMDNVRRALDFLLGQTTPQQLKRFEREMERVSDQADDVAALSDDALRAKTAEFRDRLRDGETKDDLRPEAFAIVREVAQRTVGLRPFDVQILGAIALDEHRIA